MRPYTAVVAPPSKPRRATVHDVAAAAGISRGTVSRVLNGGYVSAAARTAIEAAIAEVGYVPNTAARNLVMRRSQAVGFLALEPHSLLLDDPNIGSIMLGANEVLSVADHQMVNLVVDSARDTERVARYLSGGFVDGAIIVSARTHDPITRVIAELGLPATFVGHPPDLHRSIPFVGIDNVGSARTITERLAATGRRHIAMIAAALDRDSGADRLTGFREALGDRFDPRLVAEVALYDYASGVKGMRELLAREPAHRRGLRCLRRRRGGRARGLAGRGTQRAGRRRGRRIRRQLLGSAHPASPVDGAPARPRDRPQRGGAGAAPATRRGAPAGQRAAADPRGLARVGLSSQRWPGDEGLRPGRSHAIQ